MSIYKYDRRYGSVADYHFDPATRMQPKQESSVFAYSRQEKAFYAPVAYNTYHASRAYPVDSFDFSRLGQTDMEDLPFLCSHSSYDGFQVSLEKVLKPHINKMGTMFSSLGENLGTCTLIANNLVLASRHAIQGRDIRDIGVLFGYQKMQHGFFSAGKTSFYSIVEENAFCDYVIIELKEPLGSQLGFVPLNFEGNSSQEIALLHYPLGQSLKVSVQAVVQSNYQMDYQLSYHDSDYLSSGGAYFDPKGCMVAMHLGTELQGNGMHLTRYALLIETIIRRNPYSLLAKFASLEYSQSNSYTSPYQETYLSYFDHGFLIDEEGLQSEKILRGLLEEELKSIKI